MKKTIIVIPYYMIETELARSLCPAWVIERSVFYLHGVDWFYLERNPNEWRIRYYPDRN